MDTCNHCNCKNKKVSLFTWPAAISSYLGPGKVSKIDRTQKSYLKLAENPKNGLQKAPGILQANIFFLKIWKNLCSDKTFLTYVLRLKPSLKITDYAYLVKLTPHTYLAWCLGQPEVSLFQAISLKYLLQELLKKNSRFIVFHRRKSESTTLRIYRIGNRIGDTIGIRSTDCRFLDSDCGLAIFLKVFYNMKNMK